MKFKCSELWAFVCFQCFCVCSRRKYPWPMTSALPSVIILRTVDAAACSSWGELSADAEVQARLWAPAMAGCSFYTWTHRVKWSCIKYKVIKPFDLGQNFEPRMLCIFFAFYNCKRLELEILKVKFSRKTGRIFTWILEQISLGRRVQYLFQF